MTQNHDHRKNRSAIQWAIVELHNSSMRWLEIEPANKITGCRGPILDGLWRATMAFNQASAGRDVDKHLARTRAAIARCEAGFKLLEHVVPEIFVEAQQRIDRIVAGLDEVARTPPTEWRRLKLPGLPGQPSRLYVGSTLEILREISARVTREGQLLERRIEARRRYPN